jgi:hypothetical protein
VGCMPARIALSVSLGLGALALLSCRVEGETAPPGGPASGGAQAACIAGDRGAGETFVAELRAQRLGEKPPSFEDQRARLREACEGGCGPACLEYARTSATQAEFDAFNHHACAHGEALGCTLEAGPDAEAAAKLCADGEVLGCAAQLSAGEGELQASWDRLGQAAAEACERDEGRACAARAWARCAGASECDAEAIAAADKGARLVPSPELIETLALVRCHAGEAEAADAGLAAACAAGLEDSCARSCETLRPARPILVREAERPRYEQIMVLIALQVDASDDWYAVVSAMDAEQLAGFEEVLERLTPPVTEPGAAAEVPEDLRAQYPELVEAILRSPQLEADQIGYWLGRLPDMSEEQRTNLFESLRKQWWVIPGEPGRTPQAYVDRVRLRSGGLSPTWLGE